MLSVARLWPVGASLGWFGNPLMGPEGPWLLS